MLVFSTVTPRKLLSGSDESPDATTGVDGKTSPTFTRYRTSGLGRAADLGVFVASFALVIIRQPSGATVAPITGVELDADHGKGINAKANGTLGKPELNLLMIACAQASGVGCIALATVVSGGKLSRLSRLK
jgi:hypothetical protein